MMPLTPDGVRPDSPWAQIECLTEAKVRQPMHVPPLMLDITNSLHPFHAFVAAAYAGIGGCWNDDKVHVTLRVLNVEPGGYADDINAAPNGYREKDEETFSLAELSSPDFRNWLAEQVAAGDDVVITNQIKSSLSVMYVPMLDFDFEPPIFDRKIEMHRTKLLSLGIDLEKFKFYLTGRSFHAYGQELLNAQGHANFLAKALLLEEDVVDARWVGHSLMRGFGSLRWTATSRHYSQVPALCESPFKIVE